MRATKSTFNERRRIVVYDPFSKKLWMLNGSYLDSEILRLTDYAMENLKKALKVRHRVTTVAPEDSRDKFDHLLNLAKNPDLAEIEAESAKTKKKSKKSTAKKKKSIKTITKKTSKPKATKSKKKSLPRVETSTIPKVNLPTPTTKSTLGIAKGDLHDDNDGSVQMVEDFQITYYETLGGSKLVIEELEDSIMEGEGYNKLVDHIKLINEHVKSKSVNKDAHESLVKSISELVDTLFPVIIEKPKTKKTAKRTSKKTSTPISTKKAVVKKSKMAKKKSAKKSGKIIKTKTVMKKTTKK